MVLCVEKEKSDLLLGVTRVLSFFSSLLILSFVSVVFDFNDSLNDVAPLSPILLSVEVIRKEKSELLMDAIYVSFICLHYSS